MAMNCDTSTLPGSSRLDTPAPTNESTSWSPALLPWRKRKRSRGSTSATSRTSGSGMSVPIGLTFAGCRNGGRTFGALRMRSNTNPVDG